ncbi:hypothetical protein AMR72_16460 [Flavobacterium psychrophilum]|nr:hypothetical protein AMR72_16460 [Flavobacterium psychrophilum]AOE53957.1 hypothetical protein ALW18_16450 [Flavobacterium psychrophilum]
MRKITLLAVLSLVLVSAYSFKEISDLKRNAAEVVERDGILIFADSKPVAKYEVIGEVKLGFGSNSDGTYKRAISRLVEIAKDKYPTGKALILKTDEIKYSAEVIDFRD